MSDGDTCVCEGEREYVCDRDTISECVCVCECYSSYMKTSVLLGAVCSLTPSASVAMETGPTDQHKQQPGKGLLGCTN